MFPLNSRPPSIAHNPLKRITRNKYLMFNGATRIACFMSSPLWYLSAMSLGNQINWFKRKKENENVGLSTWPNWTGNTCFWKKRQERTALAFCYWYSTVIVFLFSMVLIGVIIATVLFYSWPKLLGFYKCMFCQSNTILSFFYN